MPPLPGEERVQTVFADVHYYFVAPTPRPLHHRFDKGSYLYIYHNTTRRTARLEIANNPGQPEQDAFHGGLDGVRVRYSYKFPTLLTLVVDPSETSPNSPTPPSVKDPQEWRLASGDPRDAGQFKYRLHTLDIYFWTQEDTKGVVDTLKRLLHPQQLDVLEAPRTVGAESLSPVVQQLESVAITDPAYANGQTRNSQNVASSVPPPPPLSALPNPRQSPSNSTAVSGVTTSVKSDEAPANFAPMAYNPAAPAAPEPIAHREKTPPPVDAGEGTGLASAAYADHNQSYPQGQHQGYPGMASPPQQGVGQYGSPPIQSPYAGPPSAQYLQHTPSLSGIPSSHRPSVAATQHTPPSNPISPPLSQSSLSSRPGYVSPPQDTTSQYLPAHLQHQPQPLESPSAQIYGNPSQPHHHQPVPHVQPQYTDYLSSRQQPLQPPPGGYPQYSYPPQQQQQHHHHHHQQDDSSRYDVHQQFYQPTAAEENKHKHRKQTTVDDGRQPGKLEETAGKVDKKVSGFLKKLEKRL